MKYKHLERMMLVLLLVGAVLILTDDVIVRWITGIFNMFNHG